MRKSPIIKVDKIAFTKLRKLDVWRFYNDIVNVVKDYDAKEMHIDNTCDVLFALQPKTNLLIEEDYGPHPLTPMINELREKRFKFAGIITNHMRLVENADFSDKQHLVTLVKPLVLRQLSYLRENDLITVDDLVNVFFKEVEKDPEIKEALYELGFKPYLDELESTNSACIEAYYERMSQRSKRRKGSTLPIQRELQNIVGILFDQVDYYQHVYTDVNYFSLITALNHVIATYTKKIKTRDTKRKNKKLKAKGLEQINLEQEPELIKSEEEETVTDSINLEITDMKQKSTQFNNQKKKEEEGQSDGGLMNLLKKTDKGK